MLYVYCVKLLLTTHYLKLSFGVYPIDILQCWFSCDFNKLHFRSFAKGYYFSVLKLKGKWTLWMTNTDMCGYWCAVAAPWMPYFSDHYSLVLRLSLYATTPSISLWSLTFLLTPKSCAIYPSYFDNKILKTCCCFRAQNTIIKTM